MSFASPLMNLVVIRSGDIDRAAHFYGALGLVLTKHRHGTGPMHYACEWDRFVFEIYPVGASGPTAAVRMGFSVEDVDSVVEALQAVGGELRSGPDDSEWGRRAVMKDLDGHTVEIVTPPNRD